MNKKILLPLLLSSFLADHRPPPPRLAPQPRYKKPLEKIIPKGCKQYFFNQFGSFSDSMLKTETVFHCIASSDKAAVKKFNKWQEKQVQ